MWLFPNGKELDACSTDLSRAWRSKKKWYFLFDACEADLLLNYHSIYNPEYSRETWIDNIAYPHILH